LIDIGFLLVFPGFGNGSFTKDLDILINVCWTPINFWHKDTSGAKPMQEHNYPFIQVWFIPLKIVIAPSYLCKFALFVLVFFPYCEPL